MLMVLLKIIYITGVIGYYDIPDKTGTKPIVSNYVFSQWTVLCFGFNLMK